MKLFAPILLVLILSSNTWAGPGAARNGLMAADFIWYHITSAFTVLAFKLALLIVGYLIARLGYELLVKGITGQFKFSAEFKGKRADLVSASPGLFFILLATSMIAFAVLKDNSFSTTLQNAPTTSEFESRGDTAGPDQGESRDSD